MTYQKVGGRILEYEKDEGNTKREESNTCRGQREFLEKRIETRAEEKH